MAKFAYRRLDEVPLPKTLMFSRKAQYYFQYLGNLDAIKMMADLRYQYLQARTLENINRISTFEMEQIALGNASMPQRKVK